MKQIDAIETAYLRASRRWALTSSQQQAFISRASALGGSGFEILRAYAERANEFRFPAAEGRAQVEQIAKLADQLIDRIMDLPETLVDAMEGKWPAAFKDNRRGGISRVELVGPFYDLINLIRNIEVEQVPGSSSRGRPTKDLAVLIAEAVIRDVEDTTGKKADMPADAPNGGGVRGLVPLIRRVFKIFGIEGSAKAAFEAALKERAQNRAVAHE